MKHPLARILLILVSPTLFGCGMCRSIEQWKCDNWGMCHFAPNRPGLYAPMSVQPTYGPPVSYAANPGGTVVPGSMVPSPAVAPPGATVGGPVQSNCKDCNR